MVFLAVYSGSPAFAVAEILQKKKKQILGLLFDIFEIFKFIFKIQCIYLIGCCAEIGPLNL
jgi:hypothetical protein